MRLVKAQVRLGQLLVERRLLTQEQLESVLAEQKKTKGLLGEILIKSGLLTDEALYNVLSEQSGIEFVHLKQLHIPHEVIEQIPVKFALHYKIIPIEASAQRITVATSSMIDVLMLDDLRLVLNKAIKLVMASERDVTDAIKKYYGVGAETMDGMAATNTAPQLLNIQAQETQELGQSDEHASIMNFVNQILVEAYKERATDIHIEPFEDALSVRYRIDGILYDTSVPPSISQYRNAIVSRIKIMANLNISETRLPQDGRIRVHIENDAEVDLRVSILPTAYGESVVIRLLSSNVFFGIENLGLLKRDLKTLERLIRKPNGILFVTGPTGAGKTTTLYASLSQINKPDKKIITIEDPIEYRLKGITQVQVHPKINLTFAQALRSMLRHDPDVMMVGEVRDYETAEITIRVALTGHLVLSTLHTNSAAGGVTRLADMGVEPFLIASSVLGFMAQRLVRTVCPDCKYETTISDEFLKEFGLRRASDTNGIKFYSGRGCEACKSTGYKGRTSIYELLVVNAPIKELILQKASSDRIEQEAIRQGMRTLRQDGWEKILLGLTTPEEVIRVTQFEETGY